MVWNKGLSKHAGATEICERCGKVTPYPRPLRTGALDWNKHRWCSNECANLGGGRRKIKPENIPTLVCQHCKRTVQRPYNRALQGFDYSRKFCSRECSRLAQIKTEPTLHHTGYMMIQGRAEHRVIMEQHLGRRLKDHETVHHKDGNRVNNALSNLELWSTRHGRGQRVSDKIAFCIEFLREYGYKVAPNGRSKHKIGQ